MGADWGVEMLAQSQLSGCRRWGATVGMRLARDVALVREVERQLEMIAFVVERRAFEEVPARRSSVTWVAWEGSPLSRDRKDKQEPWRWMVKSDGVLLAISRG